MGGKGEEAVLFLGRWNKETKGALLPPAGAIGTLRRGQWGGWRLAANRPGSLLLLKPLGWVFTLAYVS